MKKYALSTLLLAALAGGVSTSAAAEECYPCAPSICESNSYCNGRFIIGADWLYWQSEQDNQPVANLTTVATGTTITSDTKSINTIFKAQSGYRVTLGFETNNEGWEANAIYTYVPGKGHTKTTTPIAGQTISTPFTIATGDTITSYTSKWKMNLNMLDLDVSRKLCCGNTFTIQPHVGFRALYITDKLTAAMPLTLPTGLADIATGQATGILKEDFYGYGIEGGLWATWDFGCGISLVGHFGGSVLYSKFRVNSYSRDVHTFTTGLPSTTFSDTSSTTYRTGTPTVDYFAGLEYSNQLCGWEFDAHLGWEQHVFFNVNKLLNEGNLYTQGLVLGLDAKF